MKSYLICLIDVLYQEYILVCINYLKLYLISLHTACAQSYNRLFIEFSLEILNSAVVSFTITHVGPRTPLVELRLTKYTLITYERVCVCIGLRL